MIEKPVAIDLFSGCGGLSLGLKKAGFNVIGAIEYDYRTTETYKNNHPDVYLINDDIRNVDIYQFMKKLCINKGQLDLLAGCPPCQGFSVIRRKNRKEPQKDERNDLIFSFYDFIEELYPKTIMMENVPGLEKDKRFLCFRDKIKSIGYNCDYRILDLQYYGVPQRRKRLVFLATRTGIQPDILKIKQKFGFSVRDTIGYLEEPKVSNNPMHKLLINHTDKVKKRIAAIPKDGGNRLELPKSLWLKCHDPKKCNGFKDVYGRMSWEKVSPTITGGCFNPSKGRFIHPEQDRAISIFEAALLQSFPRDYIFEPKYGISCNALMIGNALPPIFAEEISKYVISLI